MLNKIKLLTLLLFTYFLGTSAQNRFVLTGGPGVGKSSVITLLQSQGHQTITEAYATMQKEVKLLFNNQVELRRKLMSWQQKSESLLDPSKPAFLDRGVHDIIFFADYFNIEIPQDLRDQTKKHAYDLIFFLEPLPEQYYQQSAMRGETREMSLKIHQFLYDVYKTTDMPVILVPSTFTA